jgi:plastocyanin
LPVAYARVGSVDRVDRLTERSIAMWKSMIALTIAVGLAAAGCGGGGDSGGSAAGSPSTPTNATTTAAPTTAAPTTTAPATPTAGETSGEAELKLEDFEFSPKTLDVAPGASIRLENEGQAPHTITIDGQGVDEEVQAGDGSAVTLDLSPGTYDYYCRFHKAQGMSGTLTVSG